VIRAQWIISEAGLQSLNGAGVSTGWLKAWVRSAGADSVSIHLLESHGWQHEDAEWRIFFADESELLKAAVALGLKAESDQSGHFEIPDASRFMLDNPQRTCWSFQKDGSLIIFISQGDIAYQRWLYLNVINGGKSLIPLAIYPDNSGAFELESGLSGSLLSRGESLPGHALNGNGMLIEEQVVEVLRDRGLTLRTVESCTAGAIAGRIGRVPGASDVLDRSWVTYSNAAKSEEVGVAFKTIESFGAVSREVVSAMAEGGCDGHSACIAVSGIAGPGGGSDDKPVGTVWIAVAIPGESAEARLLNLSGSRHEIQWRTVNAALSLLLVALENRRS